MHTQCPYCEKKYIVSELAIKKQVRCANSGCGKHFTVFDLRADQEKAVGLALKETPPDIGLSSTMPPPFPKNDSWEANKAPNLFANYSIPHLSSRMLIAIASLIIGLLIFFLSFVSWALSNGNIKAADIAGCYIDEGNPNSLLEFEENGRFISSSSTRMDLLGEWRIKDNRLILSYNVGARSVCKAKGNKIIEDEDVVWIKMKDMPVSKNSILGKYLDRNSGTTLDIYKDSRFALVAGERGLAEEGLITKGMWKLNGCDIIIAINAKSVDSIGPDCFPCMKGKIKGNIIRTNTGYWFVKEEEFAAELKGEEKVLASQGGFGAIKNPFSKDKSMEDFAGRYTVEEKKDGAYKKVFGIKLFKEDGTVKDLLSDEESSYTLALWGIENGIIWFGDENKKINGKVDGNTITFCLKNPGGEEFRFTKQE